MILTMKFLVILKFCRSMFFELFNTKRMSMGSYLYFGGRSGEGLVLGFFRIFI